MSVAGLVRKSHYEEVLNAAVKDTHSQHGILSVPMQRFATQAINSPLFQRVQATLEQDLASEQKQVLEQRGFENNLTRLSVEARVPKEDLQWLVQNLQPPPPPPPPQPPPQNGVDYERMAAEIDALMQRRSVETSHQALATDVRRQLAAQSVATPAQQIIHEHHHRTVTQPVPVALPHPPTLTGETLRTGKSFHEAFVSRGGGAHVSSTEFPAEMQRPSVAPTGAVKSQGKNRAKEAQGNERFKITRRRIDACAPKWP